MLQFVCKYKITPNYLLLVTSDFSLPKISSLQVRMALLQSRDKSFLSCWDSSMEDTLSLHAKPWKAVCQRWEKEVLPLPCPVNIPTSLTFFFPQIGSISELHWNFLHLFTIKLKDFLEKRNCVTAYAIFFKFDPICAVSHKISLSLLHVVLTLSYVQY